MLWHFFGSLSRHFLQAFWGFCLYICHLFLKTLAFKVYKLPWELYFRGLCLAHWDSDEALPRQEESTVTGASRIICSLSKHHQTPPFTLVWVTDEIHLSQWIWMWEGSQCMKKEQNRIWCQSSGICNDAQGLFTAGKKCSPTSGVMFSSTFPAPPGYSWSSSCPRWVKIQTPENLRFAHKIVCSSPITLGAVRGCLCRPLDCTRAGKVQSASLLWWWKYGKAEAWWSHQSTGALEWSLLRDVTGAKWIP